MPFTLEQTTAPATEPITTAEAKSHLRVDISDDDTLIDNLVTAARLHVERITNRSLITQTWKYYLDGVFPNLIRLPRGPIQSVTNIKYLDIDGAEQTVSTDVYRVDTVSEPARVVEEEDEDWPDTENTINAIYITYDAGYGDNASDVPQPLRQAILLLVGNWYREREATVPTTLTEVPMAVNALLQPYKVYWTGQTPHERRQA